MPFLRVLLALAALTLPALPHPASAQDGEAPLGPGGYRWLAEGPQEGPLYLIISIERQRMHVYSGDRLIGSASVSTGTKGHRTPTGEFPILQKREWHRSNIYSNAPMPFMQRLTWDGIALHAGHNPGYPASHGCIRLPTAFAKKLFALTQIGTLVRVNSDDLRPALMLDTLVLNDPGTAVVTFTPGAVSKPVREAAVDLAEAQPPMLAVDPDVFRMRLRRR
ncbi:MAG TPA: L,D-transpeptidase family protein [Sphingobium sp.]|nr:L,D-transpeptidase family protein [Sphingobium sp.]